METNNQQEKFLLIGTISQGQTDADVATDMGELASLVKTYGGKISEFLSKPEGKKIEVNI